MRIVAHKICNRIIRLHFNLQAKVSLQIREKAAQLCKNETFLVMKRKICTEVKRYILLELSTVEFPVKHNFFITRNVFLIQLGTPEFWFNCQIKRIYSIWLRWRLMWLYLHNSFRDIKFMGHKTISLANCRDYGLRSNCSSFNDSSTAVHIRNSIRGGGWNQGMKWVRDLITRTFQYGIIWSQFPPATCKSGSDHI